LSVFSEFTPLAQQYNAINLGQGFPDYNAPQFVIEAAQKALSNNFNQYTRSYGHLRLTKALKEHFSSKFERDLNHISDIAITIGATEGIFATMQALINPGEEVIVIEPFYDSYIPSITMAGGIVKYVSLKPSDSTGKETSASTWKLNIRELINAITSKTKLIIINNPSNIPGKVFTRSELLEIADVIKKYNLLVLSDEVYEAMVYKNFEHTRIATLPDMWDRTITLGSAGKSFSVTGFKVGWAIGPAQLINAIFSVRQYVSFCVSTPLQEAIAIGFEESETRNYFTELKSFFEDKKQKLLQGIIETEILKPVEPNGSYFFLANFSNVSESLYISPENQNGVTDAKDYQFCRWLTREIGVAAIPISPFYSSSKRLPGDYIRFCFCKRDEVLEEGIKRLKVLQKLASKS